MKLLRIIRSLHPSSGGPVAGLASSSIYLRKLGIYTTVICLDLPSSSWLNALPFDVIPLGPVFSGYGFSFSVLARLKLIIKDYDAVIIEGLWQFHSLASWICLRRTSIPYYIFVHGMLDPWFNINVLKYTKKCFYWALFERHVLNNSNGVLFTTDTERVRAITSFPGFKATTFVVGFGSTSPPDIGAQHISEYYSYLPQLIGKRIVLFLGRIHPKKGLDLLIQAFAKQLASDSRYHLLIIGPISKSYSRFLVNLIQACGLANNVTIAPPLYSYLKWAALRTADVFCLPSHQENFGVAVAEALSVGLPVCISSAVNISELVEKSGAGLVHPDTLSGTIDALSRWADMDHDTRVLMSRSAMHLFSSQFDWEHVSERLAELLNRRPISVN